MDPRKNVSSLRQTKNRFTAAQSQKTGTHFGCLSEEAFFRGFIQREIGAALRGTRAGNAIAIAVSAGLFGLAHFGGGVSYVVLAAAAGLGYAIVYHRTKSIEMSMLAHLALNTVHFLLFTYPAVA